MPRLTYSQWLLAICSILLVAVLPATISYSQAFSAEPMALTIAKDLRSRGWDVTIPDWAPLFVPPFLGVVMFIILVVQLRQQHAVARTGGGQKMPEDRLETDQPPPITIGTNYGQFAGVNRGFMHQTVNLGPPRRSIAPDARERMIAILTAHPSKIAIWVTQNDVEARQFRELLVEIFREAGWEVNDEGEFSFFGPTPGLCMTLPPHTPGPDVEGPPKTVAQAIMAGGYSLTWNYGGLAESFGIVLQVWDAPVA